MKLYHGGLTVVETPRIISGPHFHTTDFGFGFYTTTDYEQAKKWVGIRRARGQTTGGAVSAFDAPDDLLQHTDLRQLIFHSVDRSWLDFVMHNRHDADFAHNYDIVAGPVANDNVYAALSLFEQGFLDAESTILRLKTYTLVNQIFFHTEKALKTLHYTGSTQL
jgi:hypothetical protein